MVRRVITGNDAAGKSYFVSDDIVDDMNLWQSLPGLPLGSDPDGASPAILPTTAPGIEPPAGGSKCVLVSMKPWKTMQPELARGDIPGLDADGFHRTATVDYIILVSGEVTLALEEGETIVRAGDLVVQRNTVHSWRNHTDEPVVFWGVMSSIEKAG